MQGVLDLRGARFPSKKAVREAVALNAGHVYLEATSMFGNEYGGPVSEAPDGTYTFVGPDPYRDRKFYGTIKKLGKSIKVL